MRALHTALNGSIDTLNNSTQRQVNAIERREARTAGIVDTKGLGRPSNFSGKVQEWKGWQACAEA
eukprot:12912303-Prorocentrum_lima.AAC.1